MNVTLHLTGSCNFDCDYCYAKSSNLVMSRETALRAVDFAAGGGGDNVGLSFFGGEPLLEKRLMFEVVDYCRSIEKKGGPRFYFKISTNGSLVDREVLDLFAGEDFFVSLSCDGCADAHDHHRRFPDGRPSFETVRKMGRLLLEKVPKVIAVMVVTPETSSLFYESVCHLFDEGFRMVMAEPDFSAEWNIESFEILKDRYEKLALWYIELMENKTDFYFSPFDERILSHIRGGYDDNTSCHLGYRDVSIAPDGKLYPCVTFVYASEEWSIGDVGAGLDEDRRAALHASACNANHSCGDCALKPRCRTWCGCINFRATGDPAAVSSALCTYERMLFPIADRIGTEMHKKKNKFFRKKFYKSASNWETRGHYK